MKSFTPALGAKIASLLPTIQSGACQWRLIELRRSDSIGSFIGASRLSAIVPTKTVPKIAEESALLT